MGDVIDAGDVVTTRDLVLSFLTPLATRDWAASIPDLEWNCETTLRHMIKAQACTPHIWRPERRGASR